MLLGPFTSGRRRVSSTRSLSARSRSEVATLKPTRQSSSKVSRPEAVEEAARAAADAGSGEGCRPPAASTEEVGLG